jgi:hypothetical protein
VPPWPSHRARPGKGEKPQPLEGFGLASFVCVRAKHLGARIHPRQRELRHRAVNHAAPSRRRVLTPSQSSSFSSPWRVLYPVRPCRGMAQVTAVDPRHRRAAAEPLPLLGFFVEHLVSRSKTRGVWACTRGHRRSNRIPCGRPPRAEPHPRPHRNKPKLIRPDPVHRAASLAAPAAIQAIAGL